jgi:hypothetical protein
MAGLVPAIHVLIAAVSKKAWMPGTRPGMTIESQVLFFSSSPGLTR